MAAFPNITPKVIVQLYQLFKEGKVEEAMKLQTKLAEAEWSVAKIGKLAVLKALVVEYFGYGGNTVRKPLKSIEQNDLVESEFTKALEKVVALEKALA